MDNETPDPVIVEPATGHDELWTRWVDALADVEPVPLRIEPNHRPLRLHPRTVARIEAGARRYAERHRTVPPSPLVPEQLPPGVTFTGGLLWMSPSCTPEDEARSRFRRALMDGLGRTRR